MDIVDFIIIKSDEENISKALRFYHKSDIIKMSQIMGNTAIIYAQALKNSRRYTTRTISGILTLSNILTITQKS